MRRAEDSQNPYEPPATINQSVGGSVRSFQVGVDEINTVFVRASFWTGIRTYSTDAAGTSGPVHRGPCQFEVGNRERHQVKIEVDDLGKANAYVDGRLVEENLFARLRTVIFFSVAVFVVLILLLVAVFLHFWIRYEPDKIVDRWIESQM